MHFGQAAGSRKKISTKHSLQRVEQEVARGGGVEQERWVDFSSTSPGTTLETRASSHRFSFSHQVPKSKSTSDDPGLSYRWYDVLRIKTRCRNTVLLLEGLLHATAVDVAEHNHSSQLDVAV